MVSGIWHADPTGEGMTEHARERERERERREKRGEGSCNIEANYLELGALQQEYAVVLPVTRCCYTHS